MAASVLPIAHPRPVPHHGSAWGRLTAAFRTLDEHGILARHYPRSERAEADAFLRAERVRASRPYVGRCFYHRHLLTLTGRGALAFCHGPAPAPPTHAERWSLELEVGRRIEWALRGQGFDVAWAGLGAELIHVRGEVWGPEAPPNDALVAASGSMEGGEPKECAAARAVHTVLVCGAPGSSDAQALLRAIGAASGRPVFASPERCSELPAAVTVPLDDARFLDFVAGPADASARGLLKTRDLARESEVLVMLGAQAECPWWSWFPAKRRAELPSGAGLAEVLRALAQPGRLGDGAEARSCATLGACAMDP